MEKQDLLNAEIKQISQVYSGKRDCCRCGCKGTYTATSYMINNRSDVDDKKVQRNLNRAKKLVLAGADVECGDTYIDVQTGNDRCLTFYFDEVKS